MKPGSYVLDIYRVPQKIREHVCSYIIQTEIHPGVNFVTTDSTGLRFHGGLQIVSPSVWDREFSLQPADFGTDLCKGSCRGLLSSDRVDRGVLRRSPAKH